jgi:hypothetical protein
VCRRLARLALSPPCAQELYAKAEALLTNASARHEISRGMKEFFRAERQRAARHVRGALQRSLHAAASARAAVGQRSELVVGPLKAAPRKGAPASGASISEN